MSTLRGHIERRVAETGKLTTADRAMYRVLVMAINERPPLVDSRAIRDGGRADWKDPANVEAALEPIWQRRREWIEHALDGYLAIVATLANQPTSK